ncbi:hypothetical protein Tco_1254175 [Tanacetum coccineum]
MASNKFVVSSPMVEDCVNFVSKQDSFISDGSVNSKPSVTELNDVNDEDFMVDKKYVNVTDLNLVYDEKVSISDKDDLEKKIDDVKVLNNVVCVDVKAKTSAAVDFVVIKECYDTKQDESGDVDMNNCPDIPKFTADPDSKDVFDSK